MKLEFYQPQSDLLKKYMLGYYFITPYALADKLSYYTFPNNYFIVSVNLGAKIEMDENEIVVSRTDNDIVTADFVTRYNSPLRVLYTDPVPEITFYFKPAGINHFINDAHLVVKHANGLGFNPYPDFYPAMKSVFAIEDRSLQIAVLEKYWIAKFNLKNTRLLEAVIADLESDLSITAIAAKHNFSRQYLNSLFVKNIGKSPSEYRKIHRFRDVVKKRKHVKKLTSLTYESLFFDQSHMIKDFKKITSLSPHVFFKNVDTGKENIWLFI